LTHPKSQFSKKEYEALAEIRYAIRRFLHFSKAAAQAVGLTPQHHQALLAIRGFPGRDEVTVGELAERLQIRPHSTVGLVDRLVAQNLVMRKHGDGDHRQVHVCLTDHGAKLLEALTATHREELRHVGPQLTEAFERLRPTAEAQEEKSG
jgi:DNA-binding MarR family transcriptional regulator